MRHMFASRVHFRFKYIIDLPKCQNTSEYTTKKNKLFITNNQVQTLLFLLSF